MFTTPHSIVNAHEEGITSIRYGKPDNPNNNRFITGSADGTVKSWNSTTFATEHRLIGHQLAVVSVDINSQATFAASSSVDSEIKFWDLQDGKELKTLNPGPVECWSVKLSPDARFLASGTHSGNINVWELFPGSTDPSNLSAINPNKVAVYETRGKFVMSVAYSPNGKYIASGSENGTVYIFDIEHDKLLHKIEAHSVTIRSVEFSENSEWLVIASDSHISICDVHQANVIGTFTGHNSWVLSAVFTNEKTKFVSGSSDKKVKVWDALNKQCLHTYDEHSDQVWAVGVDRSYTASHRFASVSDDKSIQIHDISK